MAQDHPQSGQLSDFVQMNRRGSSRSMDPPLLSQYPDTLVYEVSTLVQLIKVRPLTLWAWEQQLGISSGDQGHDANGHKRRYSERDLVALLWVRDMVIGGESPQEAAARLLAAQRGGGTSGYLSGGAMSAGPYGADPTRHGPAFGSQPQRRATNSGGLNSGALSSDGLNSGALYNRTPTYDPTQANPMGEPWAAQPSGSLAAPSYPGMNPAAGGAGMRPTQPGRAIPPDPWNTDPWGTGGQTSPQDTRPGGFSGPLRAGASSGALQMAGPSGRLGAIYGASLEPSLFQSRGASMSQSLSVLRELRPAVPQLLQSFARFDTARAGAILQEALRQYSVEDVCVGLVQPAVARISELWSKSELTNPEERFALNYLRGFMSSVYHLTQEPLGAPFAVVGCAPNETSDFGALLLAVLWRRAGLRVVYLGRGIDGDQLLQQRWPITPAIVALTATTPQRIRALARIGKKLGELPAPQPIFAYSGPIFVRNPDLKRKLTGVYLGDDAVVATRHVRQLLNMDVFGE